MLIVVVIIFLAIFAIKLLQINPTLGSFNESWNNINEKINQTVNLLYSL